MLEGGHIVLARNREIAGFSETQYFGTGRRPARDRDWKTGRFVLHGRTLGSYDYVRAGPC